MLISAVMEMLAALLLDLKSVLTSRVLTEVHQQKKALPRRRRATHTNMGDPSGEGDGVAMMQVPKDGVQTGR